MSKKENRENIIRNNPSNVSINEFEALINRYGEIIEGGRHPKAHINKHYYPYKRHNPVDAHYVRGVLRLIDQMEDEG
jgi:hypothetical protein